MHNTFGQFLKKYPVKKIRPKLPPPHKAFPGIIGYFYGWLHHIYHYLRRAICYKTIYLDDALVEVDASAIRYQPKGIDWLLENTKFTKQELQKLYRIFKQVNSLGYVTKEHMVNYFENVFTNGDAGMYGKYFFNSFPKETVDRITFDELIVNLSILSRGTAEQKLETIFGMYDHDKDGQISVMDLFTFISSVHNLMGKETEPPYSLKAIKQHTRTIFKKFDRNGSGVVTRDQFVKVCMEDYGLCAQIMGLNALI